MPAILTAFSAKGLISAELISGEVKKQEDIRPTK